MKKGIVVALMVVFSVFAVGVAFAADQTRTAS